ncbi:MAG: amidophosphoribosyltransferase, partial [Bacteroidales bacterium]|nr:amidophosphoribosyltransferase [Bacteroidales bacterium]
NRGQEGAGVVGVKLDMPPGYKYMDRVRSCDPNPIQEVFGKIKESLNAVEIAKNGTDWAKHNLPFISEIYLGHLRYSTFGKNNIDLVHPLKRASNWRSRNLALAANFNLTNVDELFQGLIKAGQHPRYYSDTVTLLENVGYYLDDEIQNRYRYYRDQGYTKEEISPLIEENLDIADILTKSSAKWDGGYAVAGVLGHGDLFVARDPWGIRPAYYYHDDEVVVVASEASVIRTAFRVDDRQIKEISPGYALIVKKSGLLSHTLVREPAERSSCSFERIYFSRGNDRNIYKERKMLGKLLTPQIIEAVNGDLDNTVFSFIPNTAETSFYGLMKGIESFMAVSKLVKIKAAMAANNDEKLMEIIDQAPRAEKIVIKDAKLRTFITSDNDRDDMVEHVYDVTYGAVEINDNLVVIDDSIVRGTTLRKSILHILDSLKPKRIIIVSTAPQIRFPDCYGIDMSRMDEFIAFNAAVELLRERGMESIISEVYQKCKKQLSLNPQEYVNYVKEIYEPFSYEEISEKIAQMVKNDSVKAEVKIVFQTVENLHKACTLNSGDWYFTGNYPTPGGNKVVNTAYINWFEGRSERSY